MTTGMRNAYWDTVEQVFDKGATVVIIIPLVLYDLTCRNSITCSYFLNNSSSHSISARLM